MIYKEDASSSLVQYFGEHGYEYKLLASSSDMLKYNIMHKKHVFEAGFNVQEQKYYFLVDSNNTKYCTGFEDFVDKFDEFVYVTTVVSVKSREVADCYVSGKDIPIVYSRYGRYRDGGYLCEFTPLGSEYEKHIIHIISTSGDWYIVQFMRLVQDFPNAKARAKTLDIKGYVVDDDCYLQRWTLDSLEYALKMRNKDVSIHDDIIGADIDGYYVVFQIYISDTDDVSYRVKELDGTPTDAWDITTDDLTDLSQIDIGAIVDRLSHGGENNEQAFAEDEVAESEEAEEDMGKEENMDTAEDIHAGDFTVLRIMSDDECIGLRFVFDRGVMYDVGLSVLGSPLPFPIEWVVNETHIIRKHGVEYTQEELDAGVFARDISSDSSFCMSLVKRIFED